MDNNGVLQKVRLYSWHLHLHTPSPLGKLGPLTLSGLCISRQGVACRTPLNSKGPHHSDHGEHSAEVRLGRLSKPPVPEAEREP